MKIQLMAAALSSAMMLTTGAGAMTRPVMIHRIAQPRVMAARRLRITPSVAGGSLMRSTARSAALVPPEAISNARRTRALLTGVPAQAPMPRNRPQKPAPSVAVTPPRRRVGRRLRRKARLHRRVIQAKGSVK